MQHPQQVARRQELALLLGPALLGILVEVLELGLHRLHTVAEVVIFECRHLLSNRILEIAGAGVIVGNQLLVALSQFDGTFDDPSLI